MFEDSLGVSISLNTIDDTFEEETTIKNSTECHVRREEDKPRVLEHRYKRYWNLRYGKIRNQKRLEDKTKMKEMKYDMDENGEPKLSDFVKMIKQQKQNKRFLRRLGKAFNSNHIKDTIHDHNIVSYSELEKSSFEPCYGRRIARTRNQYLGSLQSQTFTKQSNGSWNFCIELSNLMFGNGLSTNLFKDTSPLSIFRYQDIKSNGYFNCPLLNCKSSWHSKHAWIRLDFGNEEIKLFGQICPSVQSDNQNEESKIQHLSNQYIPPNNLTEARISKMCRNAIKRVMYLMNTKYQIIPTAGSVRKNKYPFRQRPVSIITTLLDEEREEMEELSIKAKEGHPIGQNYCEMCNEKSRPCWTPHLLSDCSKCQKHRYHCCYDPKPFINKLDALIMDVNVMALRSRTKAGLQPMESHKMLKQINNSQSSSISPAKNTKTLMPIKTRKLSTNIDSFLFSLVPNKL